MIEGIRPTWNVPTWVNGLTTTRQWDFSEGNIQNRSHLQQQFHFSQGVPWLKQTHSNRVFYVDEVNVPSPEADASWTDQWGQVCVVLTGDCLPILLCDEAGTIVGAVHAGWRGILAGIIENTVQAMRPQAQGAILAWCGPAIGPNCFEVRNDMREGFIKEDPDAAAAFVRGEQPDTFLANIYTLAKMRLARVGVQHIAGGDYCTYTDQERFFSARKTKTSARMATFIWLR